MAKKKKAPQTLGTRVLTEKLKILKAERANFEREWQDIADYVLPRKNDIITKRTDGERKTALIFDNTAMVANELLAGFLLGMFTNVSSQWFEFTTGDSELDRQDDVRTHLQEVARRTWNVMNNSNFRTEAHEAYLDLGAFNTNCIFTEEVPIDEGPEVVRFSTKFIANYWLDEDYLGRVNQLYQEWKWRADKIVQRFGEENVPARIREAYEKQTNTEFCIVHAVYPQYMIPGNTGRKFVSHYYLSDYDEDLLVETFFETPFAITRWAKASGEKYGRGPGMNAIPEVKSLNKMAEVVLKGAQKVVDPPLMVPDDGFLMPIRTKPSSLNYYRAGSGNDMIRPILNDTRIDFGFQAMQEKRLRVREAFYIDQLTSPAGGPARTATEVMQRAEEQMRLMGPVLGRQESEFARPIIDRVYGIMERRGLYPDPPESLIGKRITIRYTSQVARTQRMAEANSITRTIQAAAPLFQVDPSVADNLNADGTFKALADIFGYPQEGLKTTTERDQIRRQRAAAASAQARQAQQAANTEQAQVSAETMKTMGEIASGQ